MAAMWPPYELIRKLSGINLVSSKVPFFRKFSPRQGFNGTDQAIEAISKIHSILLLRGIFQIPELLTESLIESHNKLHEVMQKNAEIKAPEKLPVIDFKKLEKHKFIKQYVNPGHPAVIKGFSATAFSWSLDWFFSNFGDIKFPLINRAYESFETQPLKIISEDGNYAFANSEQLFRDFEFLTKGLENHKLKDILSGHRQFSAQFFVSSEAGSYTRLHSGHTGFMYYNIQGNKLWDIIDPFYLSLIYAHLNPFDGRSIVGTFNDERLKSLPLLKYCPRYRVELEPGDLLWVPCYWWHAVKSLSKGNLAISNRWNGRPGKNFADASPVQTRARKLCYHRLPIFAEAIWYRVNNLRSKLDFNWYDRVAHGRFASLPLERKFNGWGCTINLKNTSLLTEMPPILKSPWKS